MPGIKTALDLWNKAPDHQETLHVVLERTVRESRGEPCLELEEFAPAKLENHQPLFRRAGHRL